MNTTPVSSARVIKTRALNERRVSSSLGTKPAPTGAQKGAPLDWSGRRTFLCPGAPFLDPGASFCAPIGAPFYDPVGAPF